MANQEDIDSLRSLVADSTSAWWTDTELGVFLDSVSGNQFRAAGLAYLQLAAVLSAQGQSIKTDDLGINTTSAASDLRSIAQTWFDRADADDADAAADIFEVVPFDGFPCRPQPSYYFPSYDLLP